jgi:hypothetical protein
MRGLGSTTQALLSLRQDRTGRLRRDDGQASAYAWAERDGGCWFKSAAMKVNEMERGGGGSEMLAGCLFALHLLSSALLSSLTDANCDLYYRSVTWN